MTAHPDIAGLSDWRPLARGGFAAVWQARQDSLGRQVAVKVDFRPLDDDKQRRRFLREAGAAGRLSGHPGIVTVHDAGILPDDRPYLVLELCPGGSLSAWLSPEKRPPIQRVRDVGVRIADALAAAHARGVIHRDVKPANILIDAYGHAGLTDFGLAAMPEPGSRAVGHDGGPDPGVRAAGDVPLAPGHGVRRRLLAGGHPVRAAGRTPTPLADRRAHADPARADRAARDPGGGSAPGATAADGRARGRPGPRGLGAADGGPVPGPAGGRRSRPGRHGRSTSDGADRGRQADERRGRRQSVHRPLPGDRRSARTPVRPFRGSARTDGPTRPRSSLRRRPGIGSDAIGPCSWPC